MVDLAHANIKSEFCNLMGCESKSTAVCTYCNRHFCIHHARPKVTMASGDIHKIDKVHDHAKWQKYSEDLNRTEGHPCNHYTEVWNKEHMLDQGRKELEIRLKELNLIERNIDLRMADLDRRTRDLNAAQAVLEARSANITSREQAIAAREANVRDRESRLG